MIIKVKNERGTVGIAADVIARVAGLAAMDCYGIIGMAAKNATDDLMYLLKKESLSKGVRVYLHEEYLTIDFYIIVEYGTNINAIAVCE